MYHKNHKLYKLCLSKTLKGVVRLKKKAIFSTLVIFLFILMSLSVVADDYKKLGGDDGYYQSANGIFNTGLTSYSLASRSISDGAEVPLVADLDNDGVNEIIVFDDGNLRLYSGNNLNVIDAFSLKDDGNISNALAFDIDGDNYTEIVVFMQEDETIDIIEYNGTDIYNQSSISFKSPVYLEGETMIGCGDTNDCIMVYNQLIGGLVGTQFYAVAFNSTDLGSELQLHSDASTLTMGCLPKIKTIPYVDSDNDAEEEYIVSMLKVYQSANEKVYLFRLSTNSSLNVTIETQANFDSNGFGRGINFITQVGGEDCSTQQAGNYITSPLVYDIDSSPSNGLETVIGINVNANEFTMASYDKDFNQLDDYPEVFSADGQIISNVMLADVFGDTDREDFCVLGHDATDEELDLLCASELSGAVYDTYEFKYSTDNRFNVTDDYNRLDIISHVGQHSSGNSVIGAGSTNNPDENINAYGVFIVEDDTFNGSIWVKTLTLIYEFPVEDSACIPIDVENTGSADIVCMEDTALYYIDDGLTSEGALITNLEFNPCPIDTVIKVNETIEIYVTVTDQNNEVLGQDNVNSRVYVYYNHNNEQVKNVTNTTSGVIHTYSFEMNQTISGGRILIEGWDEGSPAEVNTYEIAFTVANNGLSFGDSTCSIDVVAEAEAEATVPANESLTPADTNMVKTALIEVNAIFGIGLLAIWIIIILIIDVYLVANANKYFGNWGSKYLFAIIAGIDVLMIFLGVMFAVVSTWVLIFLLVLGIAISVIFIKNKVEGTAGG